MQPVGRPVSQVRRLTLDPPFVLRDDILVSPDLPGPLGRSSFLTQYYISAVYRNTLVIFLQIFIFPHKITQTKFKSRLRYQLTEWREDY